MASKAGHLLDMSSEYFWTTSFSERRRVCDDKPSIDIHIHGGDNIDDGVFDEEDNHDEGNGLEFFFAHPRDITSRCVVEKLKDYCKRSNSSNPKSQDYPTDGRKAVWFEYRTTCVELKGHEQSHQCQNPMGAADLYQALKKSQVTNRDTTNMSRKLIYAVDPGHSYVEALAKTVPYRQLPVLRIAIYNYLEVKSSIEVNFSSDGWLRFELNLHLSFFILNNTPPKPSKAGEFHAKPIRECIDLSFLNSNVSGKQNQKSDEVFNLHRVQFSCVVTGLSDWQWVAYCFVDGIIDDDLNELSEDDLRFDPISARKLALPIWGPREYWIKIFEIRISQVRREWEFLILKIGTSVDQYRKEHPSILSGRCDSARDRNESMKKDFDWTGQMINLLLQLDGVLSHTITQWNSFNSIDGQINFFNSTQRTKRSVDNIKATFQLLQGDRDQILQLKECCSGFSKALTLSLNIECKDTADQNGATSEFMALVLYPVALAAAIFSMQVDVIPLKPSKESFWLAVFILIVVTYLIRFLIRHAPSHWPSWQRVMGPRHKVEQSTKAGIKETRTPLLHGIRSMMGLSPNNVKDDLEPNDLEKGKNLQS